MRKAQKAHKIARKCYTQEPEAYYPQHLILKKKKTFANYRENPQELISVKRNSFIEDTNFGFSLTNQYVFVLLHLRSKDNLNTLNIKIPQICVFVDRMPYDIFFNQDGFIRSFKTQESEKCKLRDVELMFKDVWTKKNQPRNEHITAVFKEKQVLVMSETDFIIVCKKIKSDPFFKKLEYIQNKLTYLGQQIVSDYDSRRKQESILKLATSSLLGFKEDKNLIAEIGEQKYLSFLNQKITLVLNYQHNIRILKCSFHYVKIQNSDYCLVNVSNLQLNNLTKALQLRSEKLKKIEEQRDLLLIMTPEKQRKFRSYEKPKDVKKIQSLMTENFESMVKKMNFISISESKTEQIKNQLAFRKIHPEIKDNYQDFINTLDFKKIKSKLFGNTAIGDKTISIPSKYILRSYNKTKRSYTIFSRKSP